MDSEMIEEARNDVLNESDSQPEDQLPSPSLDISLANDDGDAEKENLNSSCDQKRHKVVDSLKSAIDKLESFGYASESKELMNQLQVIFFDQEENAKKRVKRPEVVDLRTKIKSLFKIHNENLKQIREKAKEDKKAVIEKRKLERDALLKEREDEKLKRKRVMEEKIMMEEKKNEIREKTKEMFCSFFIRPSKSLVTQKIDHKIGPFQMLQYPAGTIVAPIFPSEKPQFKPNEFFQSLFIKMDDTELMPLIKYFGSRKKIKKDVEILDTKFPRAKYIHFHENIRPPYFGTMKIPPNSAINPRRPFSKDFDNLNYDVDSDEEWEEDQSGESLAESEVEVEEEYNFPEDLEGFLVPHGYLSDDERNLSDTGDDQDASNLNEIFGNNGPKIIDEEKNPKTAAAIKSYYDSFKRSSQFLVPKLFGCYWMHKLPDSSSIPDMVMRTSVQMFQYNDPSILEDSSMLSDANSDINLSSGPTSRTKEFPESLVNLLVNSVHGSRESSKKIAKQFIETINSESIAEQLNPKISMKQVLNKIRQISSFDSRLKTHLVSSEWIHLVNNSS